MILTTKKIWWQYVARTLVPPSSLLLDRPEGSVVYDAPPGPTKSQHVKIARVVQLTCHSLIMNPYMESRDSLQPSYRLCSATTQTAVSTVNTLQNSKFWPDACHGGGGGAHWASVANFVKKPSPQKINFVHLMYSK